LLLRIVLKKQSIVKNGHFTTEKKMASTTLHKAATNGDLDAVKRALSQGVHVDAADDCGRTALV